jgi:hypothetical protein
MATLKMWARADSIRIFAIVEISKRGKVGVVMTSVTSRRALIPALNGLIIRSRGGRSFEIWEFTRSVTAASEESTDEAPARTNEKPRSANAGKSQPVETAEERGDTKTNKSDDQRRKGD